MGFQCVFAQSESSSNAIVGKEYMSDLETRVQSLEHAFGDLRTAQPFSQSSSNPTTSALAQSATAPRSVQLDVATWLLLISAPNQLYFGPSSTIAFTRAVFSIIENMSIVYPLRLGSAIDQTRQSLHSAHNSERWSGTTTPSHLLASMYSDQARELVIRYFDDFGSIVPVIHRASFLERFELARNGDSETHDKSWLALLNIILALALVGVSGPTLMSQDQLSQASSHQEASQQILHQSSLYELSFQIVQCQMLTGYFFKSTRNFVRAWDACNAAMHGGMHLGLDSFGSSSIVRSPNELPARNTWLAIVQLHRSLCIAFGRPVLISNQLSGSNVLEGLEASNVVGSGADMFSNSFFNASRIISDISCTIVEDFYSNNASHDQGPDQSRAIYGICDVDKRLSGWAGRLPSSLTLISSRELASLPCTTREQSLFRRFRVVLSLRYLNTRLLLYRPLCVRLVRGSQGGRTDLEHSLFGHLQVDILERAYECAAELIEIVYTLSVAPQSEQLLSVEWAIPIHYVFNAALSMLVTLVAHLSQLHTLPGKVDRHTAESLINHAVAGLDWLSRGRVSTKDEIEFLTNSLAAISIINFRNDATAYAVADEPISTSASEQPNYQSEGYSIYNDPTNIYCDLDLEGFFAPT